MIQALVDALLYELDATLGLAFIRSTLLEPGDVWAEEVGEKLDEQIPEGTARLRPLLHGAGIAELLSLFNEASTVGSAEYAVLGFTKVIEYVSATVVKQQSHHSIRTRLLSPEALRPDARFIDGLLALAEDQRAFQKDSEAIRLSVETCCDATQLAPLAPACLASLKKITEHSKAEDKRDGLRKLAECLSSTRNQIVHAKTNFNPKGAECPEPQMDTLRACARMAAQQVIRWFSDVPEGFRVLKNAF